MPNLHSSPKTPQLANGSIEMIIKSETKRFQHKGYGLISAAFLLVSFLYYFPKLVEIVWPFFLENFSRDTMYFVMSILAHTGTHVVTNGIMYVIYKLKHPFFDKYKISDKPWPWESQPELWRSILKKTLKNLAITHFVIVPLLLLLEIRIGSQMRMDLENFPGIGEIVAQIVFFTLVYDFMFYWSHRFLHHPAIYPYIHKIHHQYNISISLAAEYAHPLEFIFEIIIPITTGAKLLGSKVHFATFLIYMILGQMETADQHSGYEFPWSPFRLMPIDVSAEYHDFHHSQNVGNYSPVITLWDTLCGTNHQYYKFLANKERKQKEALEKKEKNDPSENNKLESDKFSGSKQE